MSAHILSSKHRCMDVCNVPKGPRYCYGGYLHQFIITFPTIETLHSTIQVLWTLWVYVCADSICMHKHRRTPTHVMHLHINVYTYMYTHKYICHTAITLNPKLDFGSLLLSGRWDEEATRNDFRVQGLGLRGRERRVCSVEAPRVTSTLFRWFW